MSNFPSATRPPPKDLHLYVDEHTCTYIYPGRLQLECGQSLESPQVAYNTYGSMNDSKDNVLVVCHSLTGGSRVAGWWASMLGAGKVLDPERYFIICCNVLGSCYGSTGPHSINPITGQPYLDSFPKVTIRDSVALHMYLLQQLGVKKVRCAMGGSLGGMQALEWLLLASQWGKGVNSKGEEGRTLSPWGLPALPVEAAVVMACGARQEAWQIAMGRLQRLAIELGRGQGNGDLGLQLARQIAVVSYRSADVYESRFSRQRASQQGEGGKREKEKEEKEKEEKEEEEERQFEVCRYLDYQGLKFSDRFNEHSYIALNDALDSHDVARGREKELEGAILSSTPLSSSSSSSSSSSTSSATATPRDQARAVLAAAPQPCLVIGVDSDVLYPLCMQRELAEALPKGQLAVINSAHGHDAFLLEQEQVSTHLRTFLEKLDELAEK